MGKLLAGEPLKPRTSERRVRRVSRAAWNSAGHEFQ